MVDSEKHPHGVTLLQSFVFFSLLGIELCVSLEYDCPVRQIDMIEPKWQVPSVVFEV